MQKTVTILSLIAVMFAACFYNNSTKVFINGNGDTINYSYHYFNEKEGSHDNIPDSELSVAHVKIPIFKDQKDLNDTIKNKILRHFSVGDKPDTDFRQMERHFLITAGKSTHKHLDDYIRYSIDIDVDSIRLGSGIVSMQVCGTTYWTPNNVNTETRIYPINWDLKRNRLITLDDIFKQGYKKQLYDIAGSIFLHFGDSDTASLPANYKIGNNTSPLNDTFMITPQGINFLFNPGDIHGSYDALNEIFIPYTQIKQLLRPNTVISQYIK